MSGLLLVPLLLLHQNDDDLPEDLDEVDEQLHRVRNEVAVAASLLLDDHLRVPDDEAAEQKKACPQVDLEDQLWLEKDVQEAEPEESWEAAHQGATEEQVVAVGGDQGSARKCGKDHGGHQECVGDYSRVDPHGHVKNWAGSEASQESETEQHREPLTSVLAIVRCEVKGSDKAKAGEAVQEASTAKQICEEVNICSGCGRKDAHRQAGVDALQVGSDVNLQLVVEGIEEAVERHV